MKKQTAIAKPVPKTTKAMLALTGNKMKSFSREGRAEIFKTALELLVKEEAAGQTHKANDLREKIAQLCEFVSVIGGNDDIRRQDWTINHSKIINCIRNHMIDKNCGTIPDYKTIAEETRLSRLTVHAHLSAGIANEFHKEKLKHLEFLSTDVLGKLYKMAILGNVAAAKVYLENVFEASKTPAIKQQNNYVQINNTVINEAVINDLPQTARLQIENIVNRHSKTRIL